jgi:alpha-glucosidase
MDDWWRRAVIYQIYPRSFQDSNGDGVGDLPGITRRLDHVAALGADAVWLSPIFTSPMDDMGYDVADYRDIDPVFGTLADFDAMVERAHALGLKVLIDQVLSHSSDRNAWFEESRRSREGPRADWYVWADPRPDGTPPNNWQAVFGGPAWTWEPRRRQYYLHNFLPSQPDLNFHTPEVQDAMLDVMRFWLDRGVDGFRLDTVNYYTHDAQLRDNEPLGWDDLPPARPYEMQRHVFSKNQPENLAFVERMRSLTDEYDGRALMGEIGEVQGATPLMAQYTRGPHRLHMAYSFEMLGARLDAGLVRGLLEEFFAEAADGWPCWSLSNHDVVRHVSRHAPEGREEAFARCAAAMLLSLRGTPCLYQGEETGQLETELDYEELTDPQGITFWPEDKGRDGCRTPMAWDDGPHAGFTEGTPWLPVKPPQAERAVAAQAGRAGSVLETYRDLLAFRRSRPELHSGDIAFEGDGPVLTVLRRHEGRALRCRFNLSDERVTTGGLSPTGPSQGVSDAALEAWGYAFEEA